MYEELVNKYTNLMVQLITQWKYLEQIDFKPYLDKYEDLDDLWQAVENDYKDSELTNNDFLNGHIFNWINERQLVDYLEERYDVTYIVRNKYYRM